MNDAPIREIYADLFHDAAEPGTLVHSEEVFRQFLTTGLAQIQWPPDMEMTIPAAPENVQL